nr:pentatricopeptide repeat protein AaPPR409 [Agave angustifolia]UPT49407.1 pentatricopeptide repeat protein AaPPR410 [Agave angustifolia]
MIRKFLVPSSKRELNLLLLPSTLRSSSARLSSEPQSPSWASTNQIFQKHPRLQFLHQCSSRSRLEPLLAYAIVSGLLWNPFVASRILHASTLFSPPDLTFASSIFASMGNPNIFSFNTMIKLDPSAALSLYVEMLGRGILPDKHTFPFFLKSLNSSAPVLILGKVIHAHVLVFGFEADPFVQSALLSMYFACRARDDALHLFDGIRQRDVATWTAAISGLVAQDCHEQAVYVFNAMRSEPKNLNVNPNVATMVSVMSACAGLGSLDLAFACLCREDWIGT